MTRNVAAVDFGLFAPEPARSDMVRHPDRVTSVAAAAAIEGHLSKLQGMVIAALTHHGPLTDEEIESLVEFRQLAPSTVRKRRTDLFKMGRVYALDEKRPNARGSAMMTVWGVSR